MSERSHEMAARHVEELEIMVARQREIVIALHDAGRPDQLAEETLQAMQCALTSARDHVA